MFSSKWSAGLRPSLPTAEKPMKTRRYTRDGTSGLPRTPSLIPLAFGYLLGVLALKDLTGTVVILADAPQCQDVDYLLGRFGRD